jgi:4-hydroxy-tetrahydrodipicolinate synthase
VGTGGNHTRKVLKTLKILDNYNVDGILSVCPYYNRPNQKGLYEHFLRISETTDLKIIIYNIPYRTGVNLENETLFDLAEQENIVAVKDSCGNIKQSLSLLAQRPQNLSVLTGEDILFYTTLVNGGDGGILASAHLRTQNFIDIYHFTRGNDHHSALEKWREIESFIPLLFKEPNPAPIKYCLNQMELITTGETRLPLVEISDELKRALNENLNLGPLNSEPLKFIS